MYTATILTMNVIHNTKHACQCFATGHQYIEFVILQNFATVVVIFLPHEPSQQNMSLCTERQKH